ncbi:MAG: STAS-like domain-containing protein [Pseudomonadota bacterium]
MDIEISVAEDFSPFPGGRNPKHGEFNGESFRQKYLEQPLRDNKTLLIIFDGVAGLPSSFIEEAFGGLVREGLLRTYTDYKEKFKIVAESPAVTNAPNMIERYIKDALKRKR